MEMREDMRYDGRNPYGSRGGYVSSSRPSRRGRGRGRRGDRGMMDYAHDDMRGDGRVMRSYPRIDRGDYGYDRREEDMRRMDYGYMRDGHYMHGGRQGGYEPVEFMGYCSGYYGSPDQDYARGRGGRGDYGYDMRGRYDYGYDDYGDYGETLTEKELDHWCHKLKSQLDDREKQMFSKENIMQRAKQMGIEMKGFGENELYALTLAKYLDHKQSIGQNLDLSIKLARDAMNDQDAMYQGAEWLCVYYDTFVAG